MQNYKPNEFAKMLNVSVKTLQRWDREGTLKAFRTPTDRRFYTNEQYESFINADKASGVKIQTKSEDGETGKFVVGDELQNICAGALNFERRDAYNEAEAFVNRNTLRTVGIVYGMRSTGKTVILRQLAGREEFLAQSAYLTLNYGEHSITEIYKWIGNLIKTGIKYFYIDEITWADGFVDMAMELADVWASYEGVKIMLSGTDSLAFTFAKQESLHGRYEQFSTTQMSYPEYLRIIKGNTLDFVLLKGNILDYVHCGGVFWKKTRPGRDEYTEYLESGVVWNIYNSILNTRRKTMLGEEIRFVSLKELFSICNGICNCVAAQYLYTHAQDAGGEPLVNALDTVLQNCGIAIPPAEASGIFPPVFKSETSVYEKEKVDSVIEIMRKIEFLTDIEIHSESGTKIIPMFAQTSVAHEFAYSALRAVLKSQTPRNFELLNFIEEYIDGELLDSACILTFGKDYLSVSKYRSNAGDDEIDIVAFDNRTHILYLYEIKRGLKTKTEYAKHLKKNYLVEALLEKYGTTDVKKAVLYRGDYTIPPKNDIPYYKIEDYLATYL